MFEVITGLSQEYYDSIGKHMVESWLKFWPNSLTLTVYTEDNLVIDHPRVNVISLDTMNAEYTKFQFDKIKLASRAKRFAKKAWPIMDNLESNTGYLIWVDADVITNNEIKEYWLESLIGKNNFSAHIGVMQGNYYSVETGFFIINRANQFKENFLNEYKRIYYERDFTDLHKPFDGDIFGKVIRKLQLDPNFKYHELNKNYESVLSPFNGIFDGYMTHFKAKRKNVFLEE
jgi:hypothetical protein